MMKLSFFTITKNLLCLVTAVLISIIELQFFNNNKIFSALFLVILLMTVFTVFLYFFLKNDTIFPFLYTITLVFILKVLNKSVDIRILLACLFCIALLFAQSLFNSNIQKFNTPSPAVGPYFFTLIITLSFVALTSFLIFQHVLKPLIPENTKFTLFYEDGMSDEYMELPQDYEQQNPDVSEPPKDGEGGEKQAPLDYEPDLAGGGRGGPEPEIPPEPPEEPPEKPPYVKWILIITFAIAFCALLFRFLFGHLKYRIWLKKTLASSLEIQIAEFYQYILCCLSVCGYPRQENETPYEYLKIIGAPGFPFPEPYFKAVTETFVASSFGRQKVPRQEYEKCLLLFNSLPGILKSKLGPVPYFFRYLRKTKKKDVRRHSQVYPPA